MRPAHAVFSILFLLPVAALAQRPDGDTPRERSRVDYRIYGEKVLKASQSGLKENKDVCVGHANSTYCKPRIVKPGVTEETGSGS